SAIVATCITLPADARAPDTPRAVFYDYERHRPNRRPPQGCPEHHRRVRFARRSRSNAHGVGASPAQARTDGLQRPSEPGRLAVVATAGGTLYIAPDLYARGDRHAGDVRFDPERGHGGQSGR